MSALSIIPEPIEATILRHVRDARFSHGPICVHCGAGHVIRWGTFSGRQRFRCRCCARTFSDLTATPLAYTKRLVDWPLYLDLMRRCATLRDSAAQLGLHPCTAFRWRHATLRALCASQAGALRGVIEMRELMFPYSNKGSRRVWQPRRRGARSELRVWVTTRREFVALFRSRDGTIRSLTYEHGVPLRPEIDRFVAEAMRHGCTLLTDQPRGTSYGRAVQAAGHAVVRVNHLRRRSPLHHTENVKTYAQSLRRWFVRFRGIASKYRDRYLEWRQLLEEVASWPLLERCVLHAVGECRAPP